MPILSAAWRGLSSVDGFIAVLPRQYFTRFHSGPLPKRGKISDNPVIAVTRQWSIRMIAFRWHSPSGSRGALFVAVCHSASKPKSPGGIVTATNLVCFFEVILKRPYRTIAALLGLLLPTLASAQ